jgi:hypothetical protein
VLRRHVEGGQGALSYTSHTRTLSFSFSLTLPVPRHGHADGRCGEDDLRGQLGARRKGRAGHHHLRRRRAIRRHSSCQPTGSDTATAVTTTTFTAAHGFLRPVEAGQAPRQGDDASRQWRSLRWALQDRQGYYLYFEFRSLCQSLSLFTAHHYHCHCHCRSSSWLLQFHGKGVYTYKNGTKLEGSWEKGSREGDFVLLLPGMKKLVGVAHGNSCSCSYYQARCCYCLFPEASDACLTPPLADSVVTCKLSKEKVDFRLSADPPDFDVNF